MELSENPNFYHQYSSISRAIGSYHCPRGHKGSDEERISLYQQLEQFLSEQAILSMSVQPINWFAVDGTPVQRAYACKLEDRSFVHHHEPTPGKKPLCVGHQYSCVALLPQELERWALPLSFRRIPTSSSPAEFGIQQWINLIKSPDSPFHHTVCGLTADSQYLNAQNIHKLAAQENTFFIARLRQNRVLYRPESEEERKGKGRGRPRWYQKSPLRLKDTTLWSSPDQEVTLPWTMLKNKPCVVRIAQFSNLRLKGRHGCPIYNVPISLLKVTVEDLNHQSLYPSPLWLTVIKSSSQELPLETYWKVYKKRYDIEHFFRFGKNRLLIDRFQTPDTRHEENWIYLVIASYHLLYHCRPVAGFYPHRWERKHPTSSNLSPRQVQRDMSHLLKAFPHGYPIPRGNPKGRLLKSSLLPREDHVIYCKSFYSCLPFKRLAINVTFGKDCSVPKVQINSKGNIKPLNRSQIRQFKTHLLQYFVLQQRLNC